MSSHELVQLNIARLLAPIDSPQLAEFVANLERINALAELVLWWVPAEHRPSLNEAETKLDHLSEHGPTPDAFTFKKAFPPPGSRAGTKPWTFDDTFPAI